MAMASVPWLWVRRVNRKGDAELFNSLDMKDEACWKNRWSPDLVCKPGELSSHSFPFDLLSNLSLAMEKFTLTRPSLGFSVNLL
jgi:hypothetical protein